MFICSLPRCRGGRSSPGGWRWLWGGTCAAASSAVALGSAGGTAPPSPAALGGEQLLQLCSWCLIQLSGATWALLPPFITERPVSVFGSSYLVKSWLISSAGLSFEDSQNLSLLRLFIYLARLCWWRAVFFKQCFAKGFIFPFSPRGRTKPNPRLNQTKTHTTSPREGAAL